MSEPTTIPSLNTTPLTSLHRRLGAKMGPFAGYDMPIQFEGVKAEHLWTREKAGLFDVSHMGPATFYLEGDSPDAFKILAGRIETVVPSNIQNLKPGQLRYTTLLNEEGGILDDLFVGRPKGDLSNRLYVVVNAAVKEQDFDYLSGVLGKDATLERCDKAAALLALQGPEAANVLKVHCPEATESLYFMQFAPYQTVFGDVVISRSGYTGEDGFEILVWNDQAEKFAEALLADERVKPVGLGARDSLRLEAGLHLYGSDMDDGMNPVEAGLSWVVHKRRREAGDFAGSKAILEHYDNGTERIRVGLKMVSRAPARGGTLLSDNDGRLAGVITSGGWGPSVDAAIAIAYIDKDKSEEGSHLFANVRGKLRECTICALPFHPHAYHRKTTK